MRLDAFDTPDMKKNTNQHQEQSTDESDQCDSKNDAWLWDTPCWPANCPCLICQIPYKTAYCLTWNIKKGFK
jgi:hypothetical protein